MMDQLARELQFDFFLELSAILGACSYVLIDSSDLGAWVCVSHLDRQRAEEMGEKVKTVTISSENIEILKELQTQAKKISWWAEEFYLIHLFRHILGNEPLTRGEVRSIESDKNLKKKEKIALQTLYRTV